jgi:hypothetical protein
LSWQNESSKWVIQYRFVLIWFVWLVQTIYPGHDHRIH